MNFIKVGDTVRIKTIEKMASQFTPLSNGDVFIKEDGEHFTQGMKHLGNMEFVIQEIVVAPVNNKHVTIVGIISSGDKEFYITPSMVDVIELNLEEETQEEK